ncbi:hypothetical protein BTR23_15685 [Alkalihalophilus pseudofirmus]|nr:hypothetical protein BTR23_15685 [Alkalihalophilus pseudofirmus]
MNEEPKEVKADRDYEEEVPTNETSLLFERYAIWVLIVFLLIGVWFRFVPLIIVSLFLVLLSFIIIVWKNKALNSVQTSIELSKTRIFVEEEFEIKASVYNDKWLPLVWMQWELPKSNGILLGETKESKAYLIRLLWLLWYQKVNWTINGQGLQRGVHEIGQVTLRSGDGFRFAETKQTYQLQGTIYVYPKLIAVSVPAFRPSIQWGAKGKQGGFIEDPLLVNGIRDYQAGDEFRRFNWRASARTGKLQTNVYQPVVTERVLMVIDVQGFVIDYSAYEDPKQLKQYVANKIATFEWLLSVIGTVAVKYKERGIHIGVSSNVLNHTGQKMNTLPPSANLTPFLDYLASVTQRMGVQTLRMLDELLHEGRFSSPVFIFCDYITKEHYFWYEQNKQKLTEIVFYYREETEYAVKLATRAKSLESFLPTSRLQLKGS